MKKTLIASVLAAGISFGASASEDFDAAWAEADAKRQEAAAVGFEWRDTKKILESAKKAAEEGDMDKAMQLVAQALEESNDALAQQKRESTLWQGRVPQ